MKHDFDALATVANRSNGDMAAMDRLFGAVFSLESWHFVARGAVPDVQPYIAGNASVAGGKPTVRAFTDVDRAARFARENQLAAPAGEVPVLSMPVASIVSFLERLASAGVWGIWFNSDTQSEGFFGPLASMRSIRDRCAKLAAAGAPPIAPPPVAAPPPGPAPASPFAPASPPSAAAPARPAEAARAVAPGLGPLAAFDIGWSVGCAELAAELLTLRQAGAPGSALEHAAMTTLHATGAHGIVQRAADLLPGAARPDNATLLTLYATYARMWITTNLDARSLVARSARVAMAGSGLVRATSLLLAVQDARWLAHLPLEALRLSAEAAVDGGAQLGFASAYGVLPDALGSFAQALREPLTRFAMPCAPHELTLRHTHAASMARAVAPMAWSAPLRALLASLPSDGGFGASQALLPPGSSPAAYPPPASPDRAAEPAPPVVATSPAAPVTATAPVAPAAPAAAAAPIATDPASAPSQRPRRARRSAVLPPEPRLPLRDVLARLAAQKAQLDEVLRRLLEHDGFIAPVALAIDPASVADGQVKIDAPLILLGATERAPSAEVWLFTDERAALVAQETAGSLGPHAKQQRGLDVLRLAIASPSVETIRVNPSSPPEHTFFLGRDAFGVLTMLATAVAFENVAEAHEPEDEAFRAAFVALPGIATFRDPTSKAFHTLAGDWAAPFARPAVAFTTPDLARAYFERLTPETRARLERVVPSSRTLAEVIADEREIDGLVVNPFGPGPGIALDRPILRRLAQAGSPS